MAVESVVYRPVQNVAIPNLVLIGFSGAGKSTVGRIIARRLGRVYLDVDEQIEARVGPIAPFVAERGVRAFRSLEEEVVGHLPTREGAVIAAGAGTVLPVTTRTLLLRGAVACFLDAPAEVLHARLLLVPRVGQHRPDFSSPQGLDAVRAELERRRPLYERLGIRVDATGSPETVAEAALESCLG